MPFLKKKKKKKGVSRYDIIKRADKWCVIAEGTGKNLGCHDTLKEARDQLAAVEANK